MVGKEVFVVDPFLDSEDDEAPVDMDAVFEAMKHVPLPDLFDTDDPLSFHSSLGDPILSTITPPTPLVTSEPTHSQNLAQGDKKQVSSRTRKQRKHGAGKKVAVDGGRSDNALPKRHPKEAIGTVTGTAAKVAAEVAPDVVTGGIVAEVGPRPDFHLWTVEDDLLLKNSMEAGAAMEALAKGAVRFSRRFSVKELRERWRALLYDPEIAVQAAIHMVEAEAALADSIQGKSPSRPKDMHELSRKRRLNSIRTQYYKMRKRVAADRLAAADVKEGTQNPDRLQQLCSPRQSVEGGGKEALLLEQGNQGTMLDFEDGTFSHMLSLLAAGGVGAVIGALPAVATIDCPGQMSGVEGCATVSEGEHLECGGPMFNMFSSAVHNNEDNTHVKDVEVPSPFFQEAREGQTEKLFVRNVTNAVDTTLIGDQGCDQKGISAPTVSVCVGEVQVPPATCPAQQEGDQDVLNDHNSLPELPLLAQPVQASQPVCPSQLGYVKEEAFPVSSSDVLPQGAVSNSTEQLCTDPSVLRTGDKPVFVDGQRDPKIAFTVAVSNSSGGGFQPLKSEPETSADIENLQDDLKEKFSDFAHCDQTEGDVRCTGSLGPSPLEQGRVNSPMLDDGKAGHASEDDGRGPSDNLREYDSEANGSSSLMDWKEGFCPNASHPFAISAALEPDELFSLGFTVRMVAPCLLNSEDANIPDLDGILPRVSFSQSSQPVSQDDLESSFESLTTDASEVSKFLDEDYAQKGVADVSDLTEPDYGGMHGVSNSCNIDMGISASQVTVGVSLCPQAVQNSDNEAVVYGLNGDSLNCSDPEAQHNGYGNQNFEVQSGGIVSHNSPKERTCSLEDISCAQEIGAAEFHASEMVCAGPLVQHDVQAISKISPPSDTMQPTSEGKIGGGKVGVCRHGYAATQGANDGEEEPESDLELAHFSDVEAMILDMDLDPGIDDEVSARAESRCNYRRHSRTLIRLEQGASAAMHRSLTRRGAIAIFYGYRLRYFITKAEVVMGRATQDNVVDIDLGKEGRANKVSRKQAQIKLKEDGVFYLKNLGRRRLMVNNISVEFSQRAILGSNCLIEVGGMRFIFEINHKLVKEKVAKGNPN